MINPFDKHILLKKFKRTHKKDMSRHFLSFALINAVDKNKNDWDVMIISRDSLDIGSESYNTDSLPTIQGIFIQNKQGDRVYFDMETSSSSTIQIEAGNISRIEYDENKNFVEKVESEMLNFYNDYEYYSSLVPFEMSI